MPPKKRMAQLKGARRVNDSAKKKKKNQNQNQNRKPQVRNVGKEGGISGKRLLTVLIRS